MGIRDANSGNVCRGVRAVMSRGSEETEIRRGQEGLWKNFTLPCEEKFRVRDTKIDFDLGLGQ